MNAQKIKSIGDFLTLFPAQPRRKAGNGWLVICPAHNDKNPSLWVTPSKNPAFIADWTCQAGCSPKAVLLAIGLTWDDMRCNSHKPSEMVRRQEHTIRNASGDLMATHIRLEYDNGEKSFLWERNGVSGLGRLKVADLPLFNSEKISKHLGNDQCVISEGEKPAAALENLGILSLGTVTGASSAPGVEALRPVAERPGPVYLWPDNDTPGKSHMEKIASRLQALRKPCRIIHWAEAPSKGDAADFVAAGGTVAELERLASEAPEWKPKGNSISLVCLAEVEPETVSWLWLPYIPLGKLTLLEGDPGVGKSWVSLAIATAVSLGKGLPGTETIESASVVLASAEDGLGDTIRPRLDAMRADVNKIHAIKGALDFGNGGLATMEGYIEHVRPSLVIVDPLVAYIGAGVDLHRANETRAVMAKLADIAEKHGCAILAIRHLTKGGTLKPIYRGLGSIDLAAACRSVLMAGCDSDNPQKRGIVQIKSNLAPTGKAIGYELRDAGFYWTGESDLTWQRILSAEDSESKSALDDAIDFLKDELADGAVEAKQVFSDAKNLGIYERTLNRAKSKLEIKSKREGESGKRGIARVKWQLPEDLEGQKDLGCQDCLIEDIGNVNIPDVLNMPVEKAIELWRSEGAPVIHLGLGENCLDLEKLLSNSGVSNHHLEAVRAWLEKRNQKPARQGR